MLKPKTLGMWANTDKDIFWNILPEIIEWGNRKKIQIFTTEKIQSHAKFDFKDIPQIGIQNKISNPTNILKFRYNLYGDGEYYEFYTPVDANIKSFILTVSLVPF